MVHRFGGVEGFARKWKSEFDRAVAAGPGSKFVLDSLRAILRLIEVCSRREPRYLERPEPEYSEDDLKAELWGLLASIRSEDEADPS
jgi:hypothetical protein